MKTIKTYNNTIQIHLYLVIVIGPVLIDLFELIDWHKHP